MTSLNGTPYFLPSTSAQSLANYPHARTIPSTSKTIYISGTSSRRGDGSYAGCVTSSDGTHTLSIKEQTAAVLKNIESIIKGGSGGKAGLESVVDATIFLTDIRRDYGGMNEVWNGVFPEKEGAPARTCVEVSKLPNERLCVEIKCLAIIES